MVYRSGFVALIGRPNVGKSTLINALVGYKAAIVSEKPQTTRNRIRAILTTDEAQAIFIDTPGIHKPRHKLGSYMVRVARNTLKEVDLILFIVEAGTFPGAGDRFIVDLFQDSAPPVILVVNKIDLVTGAQSEETIGAYRRLYPFAECFALSALWQVNLELLKRGVVKYLPGGPQYYPPDMVTDQPEWFIVAELIREKVLQLTRDEVPHAVAVEVDQFKKREGKELVDISAVIYVERDSQKKIVIGKGGGMLKEIGRLSRCEIEALLGSRVYLELWVKVKKDWRRREGMLNYLGYRE